jgi:hypothetical protein
MLTLSASALDGTHKQFSDLYLRLGQKLTSPQMWSKIGATPMIGQDDVDTERSRSTMPGASRPSPSTRSRPGLHVVGEPGRGLPRHLRHRVVDDRPGEPGPGASRAHPAVTDVTKNWTPETVYQRGDPEGRLSTLSVAGNRVGRG